MHSTFHLHKSRLEALVDGVFAIAMTILVLEVKVPTLSDPHSASELGHALAHDVSVIGAYFFSFAMLGIFWIWHHRLAAKIKEIDLPLLVCSLTFLSLVCFFPFAAALFGRYPSNVLALMIYVPLIGLILVSQLLFFWVAVRRHQILDTVSASEVASAHSRNLQGFSAYLFGLSFSMLRMNISLTVICILASGFIFWRSRVSKIQVT
ncbi:MAG: TMEM175 family protein [Undibacterium sp.]|nr:TMEM175 family protein [Undibacterium sp.]